MWPILLDGKFLTIVQVDPPKADEDTGLWSIGMLDAAGRVQTALYREYLTAHRAWVSFRSFAAQANRKGFCIWLMDRDVDEVEVQEGGE